MKRFKYFNLDEFTNSTTAKKHHIDNSLPNELYDNAECLLTHLDRIRERYGKPIYINSGYRCPKLNKLVGGKPNSQHTKAQAVDLRWDNDLWNLIVNEFDFDQLINECNGSWIHLSYTNKTNRHQILKL